MEGRKSLPSPGSWVRHRRSRAFAGFALTGLALFAPFALTDSVYAPGIKAPAALPEERCVLAQPGWAGETAGLFEQPSFHLTLEGVGKGPQFEIL